MIQKICNYCGQIANFIRNSESRIIYVRRNSQDVPICLICWHSKAYEEKD